MQNSINDFGFYIVYRHGCECDWSQNIALHPMGVMVSLAAIQKGTQRVAYREIAGVIGNFNSVFEKKMIKQKQIKEFSEMFGCVSPNYSYTRRIADQFLIGFTEIPQEFRQHATKFIQNWTNAVMDSHTDGFPFYFMLDDHNLTLVNASFMQCEWQDHFNGGCTCKEDFHLYDGKIIRVPTMNGKGVYRFIYDQEQHFSVLELPLKMRYVAIVIQPHDHFTLEKCVRTIGSKDLQQLLEKLEYRRVRISLPRFKITNTLNLKKSLRQVGVKEIFRKERLKLISDNASLNSIYQCCHIQVDEDGVMASAATEYYSTRKPITTRRADFIVNKPFLFLILDTETQIISFCCTVVNPSST